MILNAFIVNSLTDKFACGNPAGVVLYDNELSDAMMQTIAFEIDKSETAFVKRIDKEDVYSIRWFSPLKEVPICGHATLAASKVLYEKHLLHSITFIYRGGTIQVKNIENDGFMMDFPLDTYEKIDIDPIYQSFFPGVSFKECIFGTRTKKVILLLEEHIDLKAIKPDFTAMKNYNGLCSNGIGITKKSNVYDFESRYFNPWYGVDEDPVTGSVHTVLAGFWKDILGKEKLQAYQASQRPGELKLVINTDIVQIIGTAKVVMKGTIEV
jgi:PhzF family phenazine biosynthesis protein